MVKARVLPRRPPVGPLVLLALLAAFIAFVLFTYPTFALYALAFGGVVAAVIVAVTFRLTVTLDSGREIHFIF